MTKIEESKKDWAHFKEIWPGIAAILASGRHLIPKADRAEFARRLQWEHDADRLLEQENPGEL